MKYLLLVTLISIFSSCSKDDLGHPCCAYIDVSFVLLIKNNNGEDLLNPNTKNYYNHSGIKLYKLNNNQKQIIQNNLVISPEPNASIFDYRIYVAELGTKMPYIENEHPLYESFLELDSNDTDTIKVEILEENNNRLLNKAWYNGKLIFGGDVGRNNRRAFTIVK